MRCRSFVSSSAPAPENRTNVPLTPLDIQKIRSLEEDGLGAGEIAVVMRRHRSTVSKYMLKNSLPHIASLPEDKVDEIRRLRRDGMMTKDIAARVGVSSASVVKYGGAARPRINRGLLAERISELEAQGILNRRKQAKILGVRLQTLYIYQGPSRWGNVTTKDLLDIRTRYLQGERVIDLATEYGVSKSTIRNVINRKDRYKFL